MVTRICSALLFLALVGCTSAAKKDYEYAKKYDSLNAWERFVQRNPRSEHTPEAKERIEKLRKIAQRNAEIKEFADWESANNANSINAYALYLRNHSEGLHAEEAEKILFSKIDQRMQQVTEGKQALIRPGTEFPEEKVALKKHIEALGSKHVSRFSSSSGELSHYQLFYALNGNAGATKSEDLIYFKRTPGKFGLSVQGTQKETTASILGAGKPETTVDSKKIVGQGFVIVTVDGKTTVYEFK